MMCVSFFATAFLPLCLPVSAKVRGVAASPCSVSRLCPPLPTALKRLPRFQWGRRRDIVGMRRQDSGPRVNLAANAAGVKEGDANERVALHSEDYGDLSSAERYGFDWPDPDGVWSKLLEQAVATRDASNRRAVEALVGGKVDWMDPDETVALSECVRHSAINTEHPLWEALLGLPQPTTLELFAEKNLRVQMLVVPVASKVTRHHPPGSFSLQKVMGTAGAGLIRSLIYSRRAGGITNEISRKLVGPDPEPWVFYGGPMRQITTEPGTSDPVLFLEILITPPGRPTTMTSNHTETMRMAISRGAHKSSSILSLGANARMREPPAFVREERGRRKGGRGKDGTPADIDVRKMSQRVGGLEATIRNITRRILASRRLSAHVSNDLGLMHVRGLLLHGPPGCGKTLLAREIAKELNAKSTRIVSGPEILSKFVGDAEKTVRGMFHAAEVEQAARGDDSGLHVIIMDEFDAVFKVRGSVDDGGVRDSVCNQLLAKMDGVSQLNNILVIGLTNRKELIDPALLRPGRMEVQIEVNPPDAHARHQILEIHLQPILDSGTATEAVAQLFESGWLAEHTEGYTGADIAGLVRSMVSFGLQRALDKESDAKVVITEEDLRSAMAEMAKHIIGSAKRPQRPWFRRKEYLK